MNLDLPFLKSLWTLWMFLLFVGIIVWTFLPSRRKEHQDHASIPFQDKDA